MSIPREMGHVVLNVTDVEKSARFYRDVVGFQLSRHRSDWTAAFLTCGVVHHNLALFKAPEGARPYQKGQVGLRHFAFRVDDYQALQDAHARLVAAGTTIDHVSNHGTTRSVYFCDPDGMLMELYSDTFVNAEDGLAYMRSASGRGTPLDITAPEPPVPEIAKAG